MRRRYPKQGEHMTDTFIETVLWFMEYAWLMVIASLVLLTLPIWLTPYTVFKVWKYFKGNT
jgi:hypothetical protein